MSFSMTPFTTPYEQSMAMSPFSSRSLLDWTDPFKGGSSLINRPLEQELTRDVNRMMRQGARSMEPIANADLIETDNAFQCHIGKFFCLRCVLHSPSSLFTNDCTIVVSPRILIAPLIPKDVPGVKDVSVSVDNGVLNVTGQRERSFEKDDGLVHKSERYWGRVERNIQLPATANGDAANATYENGVLTIDIPKFEGKTSTRKNLLVTAA